jgi:hypothetical protein
MNRWIGKFPSIKMNRMVDYQSPIERDLIYLLDFEPAVITYYEQPLSIYYKAESKLRCYTPDFSVIHNGCTYLVECKHHNFLRPEENRPKWEAARCWCAVKGARFVIVTDEMIRTGPLLDNVKLLTDHARYPVDNSTIVVLLQKANANATITLGELARSIAPQQPETITPAILNLIYRRLLSTSIEEAPITATSPIWAGHTVVRKAALLAGVFN